VKKKSPPYAIILAAVLGIIAIVAFVQYKKQQDLAAQVAIAKVKADADAAIAAANAKPSVTVTSTPTNMRNVFYATQPVEAGAKISSAFFEKKLTPNEILPDAYTDQSDLVGFYAIRNIEKGDPLTPRNIGKTLPYMTQRISPGMRAVALTIFNAEVNNTGGFAVDGDRVDLLYSTLSPNGAFIIKTELVMQNLNVLYVPGPKIESEKVEGVVPAPPPGDPISVTFEVTPEQAQALVFMSQVKTGKFSMILRARRDKSEIKIKPFVDVDYYGNLQKIQRTTDKSVARVQELAAKIEAEEKTQGSQGNTNETTTPTPPSP
jgi:Flp pilus assembly protein CpaB